MKENMPASLLTEFISKGWTEIGDLKNTIQSIGTDFKNGNEIKNILQDLSDAYMICVGRLEKYLDDADYIEQTPVEAASEVQNDDEEPVKIEQDKMPAKATKAAPIPVCDPDDEDCSKITAEPVKVAKVIEDDDNIGSGEAFEYEADFDNIPVDGEVSDEDIEELRRMFSI